MSIQGDVAATLNCLACGSDRLALLPASRTTGMQVVRCCACGLRALTDRRTLAHSEGQIEAYNYAAYVNTVRGNLREQREDVLRKLEEETRGRPGRTLFDLGGGDGAFCDQARTHGFAVTGNEISPEAVALARERYDVEIALGTLDQLGLENAHDVLTMWCVLAHVEDVDGLLADTLRLLKPGGVMYMQTPRFTVMDRAALFALRASNGRMTKLADSRIGPKHAQLHTVGSMTKLLERIGFTDIRTIPRARFSLTSEFYLRSFGVPPAMARLAGRAADAAIARGAVPRIVLDVYARKPS